MHEAKIPRTIFDLVKPSVVFFAYRLLLLTHNRPGSAHSRLEVATLFETGIVTSLYEHMLMSPSLREYEIRREWKIRTGARQRPEQIDLWLRPKGGGRPFLVEVGDYTAAKAKHDLNKCHTHDPNAYCWFLALFRDKPNEARDPFGKLTRSASNRRGLDTTIIDFDKKYCGTFELFTAPDRKEDFGFALLKRK
jgi:hypothetical protein